MNYTTEPKVKEVSATDYALLLNPLLNKGTAFSNAERQDFNLFGLLPPEESTIIQQRIRSYEAFKSKKSCLEKFIYLRDLQDSNETLYYSLVCEHITEIMPIIYTPVVGEACTNFSHIYRRPRGIFIAYPYINHIDKILANPRFDEVRVIVVSDGERILGLGDQGAGGMAIPIGKLALYTACAGIHPASTLPILLDTGTNNTTLINDPLYVGWRHERIRGKDYDDFIAAFINAVKKRFPHALLQWEDFALQNATRLLSTYQNKLCSFNDDIQGTATIAMATLLSTTYLTKLPLKKQAIVIVGAGSAGCGIADLISQYLIKEGLTAKQACEKIYLIDKNGLLLEDSADLLSFQKPFAKTRASIAHWQFYGSEPNLMETIKALRPHTLIGVTGCHGLFTEALVREMAAYVARPVILPLSNPRSHSEATPSDLMDWTDGKAIVGTGSPYPPLERQGQTIRVDQSNNVYIFPGLGLGLISIKARKVNQNMLLAAAKALAELSPAKNDPKANLLPPLTELRKISQAIAFAVAKETVEAGLAPYLDDNAIELAIKEQVWQPEYIPYKLKK